MLKFRTMCADAEARLRELASSTDAGNTVLFKMKADPRVTRGAGCCAGTRSTSCPS